MEPKRFAWCGLALLFCGFSEPSAAATFPVNRTTDAWDGVCDAHCTLRDAVQAANDSPGADTIVLQATTYRLTLPPPSDESEDGIGDEDDNRNGDLDVTGELLIKGHASGTYIDGGGLTRLFEVLPGANVELRDLRLRRGQVPDRGGAVANAGTLRLVRADLRLNIASSSHDLGQGGAVFNEGTLSIADSHFQANSAGGGEASLAEGGAIYNTGRLNIRTTRFVANTTSDEEDEGGGGAIMNRGGFATIDRSLFHKNATGAESRGGAIANHDAGRLRLTNSTVSGNTSGKLEHNGGGAVANGSENQPLGLAPLTLAFTTIAANDGGGLYNAGDADITFTIVGGNYETVSDPSSPDFGSRNYNSGNNCRNAGTIEQRGFLGGLDGTCTYQIGVLNEEFMTVVLHPLADNGGFGLTHALRTSSDHAIDRVPDFEDCPATDQRGAPRPVDGDGRNGTACDIGSYERQVVDD